MHLLLDDMSNLQMQLGDAGKQLQTILMTAAIVGSIVGLFMAVCMWVIFTKAGKPGWAAIVPIYNFIVILEIVGKPWWWFLLLCIPIVNIVILIMVINLLAKSFGQSVGFTLGLIFLGIIFYPVLAFSKSIKYVGPGGVAGAPQA